MAEKTIPIEKIENKILPIRGKKVMLDAQLAELYEVPTKVLTQAVKRHRNRFPSDFMFQLMKVEFENLRSQFVTSKIQPLPTSGVDNGYSNHTKHQSLD